MVRSIIQMASGHWFQMEAVLWIKIEFGMSVPVQFQTWIELVNGDWMVHHFHGLVHHHI